MEIAEAFKIAKNEGFGPRRSVLIMAVSGEEKGLLGSKYYTDNPIYPLKNTVANLNIDMIGRLDDWHDTANYVYLIGSDRLSTDLHNISEEVNKKYIGLNLDYRFNKEDDTINTTTDQIIIILLKIIFQLFFILMVFMRIITNQQILLKK